MPCVTELGPSGVARIMIISHCMSNREQLTRTNSRNHGNDMT